MKKEKYISVKEENGVASFYISNPPINLYSVSMAEEMSRLLNEIRNNKRIKVVVFMSDVEGHFIQHLDLTEVISTKPPPKFLLHTLKVLVHLGKPGRSIVRNMLEGANAPYRVINQIARLPQITISCVEGRVGGGGNELIMATDMRFATNEGAIICQLEAALGVYPGYGGTHRLPRLTGLGPAMEMISSARDIDAETAHKWGYYNNIYSKDSIRVEVGKLAKRIASFPNKGLEDCKKNTHNSIPLNNKTLLLENIDFALSITPEAIERTVEFIEMGGQEPENAQNIGALYGAVTDSLNNKSK